MNTITIKEASRRSGFTELKIRHWLIDRAVSWGIATKYEKSSRYSYTIFKEPFEDWLERGGKS